MARIKAKSQAAKLVDKIMQTTDETLEKTGSALTKQALVPYRTELLNVMQSTIADYRLLRSKNGKTRAIPNTGRIKDPKTLSTVKSKKLVDYGHKKVLAYFHFTQDGQSRIPIKNAKKAKLTPFTYESWLEFGTKGHYINRGAISEHHYIQSIQYYQRKIERAAKEYSTQKNALGNQINQFGLKARDDSIKEWKGRIYNKLTDPQWWPNMGQGQRHWYLKDIVKYKLNLITPIRTKIKNSAISELAKQLQTEFANNISNVTK